MEIKQASLSDIPWIISQLAEFAEFLGTHYNVYGDTEHVSILVKRLIEDHIFLIAYKDNSPIGFITGSLAPHPFNPGFIVLSEQAWWISKEHRGSRAGLILLDSFIEKGKELADWITLSSEAHSAISDKHFESRGFKLQEKTFLMEVL